MNLYYINLGLDYDTYVSKDNELRYEFQQRTNYINDYFSKAIRKYKFKTDGTFNMINVSLTEYEIKSSSIVPIDVLKVYLPFEKESYESVKGKQECDYYLKLLEEGFEKASNFKPIPHDALLKLIEEFREGDCKNEWLHKKKRFKEYDIEVVLKCEFTADYFQVILIINQLSTKKELVKGVIIRTEVGVSIHEGMYKDILVEKDIIITDKADSERIVININDVFKGILTYKINGNNEMRKILSYKLNK